MDLLSSIITATAIATGSAQQLHIPQVPQHTDPLTQARYAYQAQKRIEYLTSDKGREYWREQLEIQKLRIPGEFRSGR